VLLLCIALYKAILLTKIIQNTSFSTVETTTTDHLVIPPTLSHVEPTAEELAKEQSVGVAFLKQFYQVFSQKDIETLRSLMDTPLQKSTDIRRFFSSYKITPFIDNIENQSISPSNITLVATSPSGTEEYKYTITYHLIPQNLPFEEEWIAKVRYTEN
jgi:hypothetical protein